MISGISEFLFAGKNKYIVKESDVKTQSRQTHRSIQEHIMYSFNGFCKVVIRYAASTHGATGTDVARRNFFSNRK